jgi:Integrase core domain
MCATGPASWSTSTSRSSRASPTAADGASTAVARPRPANGQASATAFLHSAIDDRTRIVYSEILDDEQGATAAAFWHRAHSFFAAHRIHVERALTDNGPCYRSLAWRDALADTSVVHKRTRPYRPQTNGKTERFHRILLEEWAYIRPWNSETERVAAYGGFIHFYNHHRPHGSLGWATPISTLGDNLPAEHNSWSTAVATGQSEPAADLGKPGIPGSSRSSRLPSHGRGHWFEPSIAHESFPWSEAYSPLGGTSGREA